MRQINSLKLVIMENSSFKVSYFTVFVEGGVKFSREFNFADCRVFVSREQIFVKLDFSCYHGEQIFTDFLQVSLWYLTYVSCIEQQEM